MGWPCFPFSNLPCTVILLQLLTMFLSARSENLSNFQRVITFKNSTDLVLLGMNDSASVPVLIWMDEDSNNPGSILYVDGNAYPVKHAALMKYSPQDSSRSVLAGSLTERLEYIYENETGTLTRHLSYENIFQSKNASVLRTINQFTSYNRTTLLMVDIKTSCVLMLNRDTGELSPLLGKCSSKQYDKANSMNPPRVLKIGYTFPALEFDFCSQTAHILSAQKRNKTYVGCRDFHSSLISYIVELDMVSLTGKIVVKFGFNIGVISLLLDSTQTVLYAHCELGRDVRSSGNSPSRPLVTPDILRLNLTESTPSYFINDRTQEPFSVIHREGKVFSLEIDPPFEDGSYSEVGIGSLGSLRWFKQDDVMMAGEKTRPTLKFIDLRQRVISSYCLVNSPGTASLVPTTPNETECVEHIFFDQLVAMSDNETMYFTTIGERHMYQPDNDTATVYKTTYQTAECDTSYLNTDNRLALHSSYYHNSTARPGPGSSVVYTCPEGLYSGLDHHSKSIECLYDSRNEGLEWSEIAADIELNCSRLDSFEMKISPDFGARFGGYEVSVVGVFPLEISVDLTVTVGDVVYVLPVTSRAHTLLSFLFPDLTSTTSMTSDAVTVTVSMPEVTRSFNFTLMESPVLQGGLPLALNTHFEYDLNFTLNHVQNAAGYSLAVLHSDSLDILYSADCSSPEANLYAGYSTDNIGKITCHLKAKPDLDLTAGGILALRAGVALVHQRSNVIILEVPEITRIVPDLQPFQLKNSSKKSYFNMTIKGSSLNQYNLQPEFSISLYNGTEFRLSDCLVMNALSNEMGVTCEWINEKFFTVQVGFFDKVIFRTGISPSVTKSSVNQTSDDPDYVTIVVPTVLTFIVIIIAAVIIVCFVKLRRQPGGPKPALTINEMYLCNEPDGVYLHMNVNLVAKVSHMTIPREKLELCTDQLIGKGNFGDIYRGRLQTENGEKDIAAKSLKGEASKEDLESLIEEARTMYQFHHEHVLSTLGVCFDGRAYPIIVLPYMAKGDLRTILLSDEKFTTGDLLHFGMQICKGMDYLHSFRYVHRDLAARNCLVSDGYVVKVADFGLSRDIYRQQYYKINENSPPLPVKWMAPESLQTGVFTDSSDVWSFGVVLWELFSRGRMPYADVDPFNQRLYLQEGHRLQKPDHCPENVYGLMKFCWNEEAEKRPSFQQLVSHIRFILSYGEDTSNYHRVFTKNIRDDYQTAKLTRPRSETGLYVLYAREAVRDTMMKALVVPTVAALKLQEGGYRPNDNHFSSETDLLLRTKINYEFESQPSISIDETYNILPPSMGEFLSSISDNNLQCDSCI